MNSSDNLQNILHYLLEKSTISLDEVLDNIEDMNNAKILEQHAYKITLNTDGRFSTYLPDETKPSKRKKVVKSTQVALEKEIIKYYKNLEKKDICLRSFYDEWLKYKSLHTKSSAYIKTIDELWEKFYLTDSIIDIPLNQLDKITLDIWAHTQVDKFDMTKKKYYNMSIIMRQALDLAVEKGIIEKNPFSNVKIDSKLFRPVKKKADETQVYLIDEQPLIEQEAYKDFEATNETSCLAIPFVFQTGMRLSEVVALKWSDISEEKENCIHIQRMEIKQYNQLANGKWSNPKRVIVERTKSYAGNRNVYLTTIARDILEKIKHCNIEKGFNNDDYIFLNAKGRISAPALDTRLRKYCRYIGISEKGMHKIRKTYISTLIDCENININYIREQVGHEDERTTYGNYCFNRKSKDRTEHDMELALVHKKAN